MSGKPQAGLNHTLSRWLEYSLKRFPILADMMRISFGLVQPRYTAGVVGVVINDQREILIVEHAFHPRTPWGLPGGWLGVKESPSAGLARELIEELGLESEIIMPLLIENGFYSRSHLDIAFLCHAKSPVTTLSYELLSYKWLSLDTLPPMLPFHKRAIEAAIPLLDT